MTLETPIEASLARFRVSGSDPDWDDVLRRAGRRGRRSGRLTLAIALPLALLAALPALALGTRLHHLLTGGAAEGGPVVSVTLAPSSGSGSGKLVLSAPDVLLVRRGPGRTLFPLRFRPVRQGVKGFPASFELRWQLTVANVDAPVGEARIARASGATVLRLCKPCASPASGSVRAGIAAAIPIFNGRTHVEVRAGTTVLRGTIPPPRRR